MASTEPSSRATASSRRQWLMAAGAAATSLALGGCSVFTKPAAYHLKPGLWRGRISIHLEEETRPQSYIAGFLLEGNYRQGTLEVYSPIGTTIAQLAWDGRVAVLHDGSQSIQDESLDSLLAQVFGTPLPTEALFAWLAGEPMQAQGWSVDLSRYGQGRIDATRSSPLPLARMRIALFSE